MGPKLPTVLAIALTVAIAIRGLSAPLAAALEDHDHVLAWESGGSRSVLVLEHRKEHGDVRGHHSTTRSPFVVWQGGEDQAPHPFSAEVGEMIALATRADFATGVTVELPVAIELLASSVSPRELVRAGLRPVAASPPRSTAPRTVILLI